MRLIGRGVEQTLLERAREVARAAGAGPGSEPDLGAPDLPRALEELAAVVWLIDAARRRDHRFPPPGPG